MTPEQFKAEFPNASPDSIRLNSNLAQNALNLLTRPPTKPAKRIRQRTKPLLNKLETEFLHRLELRYFDEPFRLHAQAIRFQLANGITYTPDFVAMGSLPIIGLRVIAYEVKGPHSWDDAIAKLKMAARAYPEITWVLAWKKDGQWQQQTVLP